MRVEHNQPAIPSGTEVAACFVGLSELRPVFERKESRARVLRSHRGGAGLGLLAGAEPI